MKRLGLVDDNRCCVKSTSNMDNLGRFMQALFAIG